MNNRLARVLIVAPEAAFFVTHRLPLALALRDRGFEVHVATPREPLVDVILQHQLDWHETVVKRRPNILGELRSIPDLYLLYRRLRPDLVHHVAIKAVLYGTAAARLARVPAVINAITGLGYAFEERRSRTLMGRLVGVAFRLLLRHRHFRMIFQNVEDRELFIERGWIGAGDAVVIRGSGVDTSVFTPAETAPSGPPLVVFASRLLASKGVGDFVRAATRLKDAGVDARFAIAGEPDPASLDTITAEQLDTWRQAGAVEVWGRRASMPAVFRETSLMVLPTYYREGVPKVLIEAAAAGVPAVTTDTPGCRDIVVDGVTGLLVKPRDVDALTEAISLLLGDPARRRSMGIAARARVEAHFSLDRVLHATLAVYDDLLETSDTKRWG